jgi:hypothetical protein
LWGEQPRRALRRRSGVGWKPQPAREQAQRLTLPAPKPFKKPLRAPWRASGYEHIAGRVIVLLRGGGQHPGHQQDESQSQRKEFRLNQREHDAMPTLDYHNCKRLITAAPTPATTTHTPAGAVLDLEVQCPLVRPRSEQNRSLGGARQPELAGHKARDRLPQSPAIARTETALRGWACEIRTQKCRRKLSV